MTSAKGPRKQLNMEIILHGIVVDSKCYPLMENNKAMIFWRSSCKVLAANKALYHEVSGWSAETGRASVDL